MSLGETGDFRTEGFKQVLRFPGQGTRGGDGSAFLPSLTPPLQTSNSQPSFPMMTLPQMGRGSFTLPQLTFPSLPTIPPFTPTGGGGLGSTGITVQDLVSGAPAFTGITTLTFNGNVGVTNTTPGQADVVVGGGGGGGGSTTLVYGYISAVSRPGTPAIWSYTVVTTTSGTVTAYNLLEKANTASSAYGYVVTSGDRITGTNYYVRAVPTNTWVRMEYTSGVTGTPQYWFSAPNFISGTC
jgi:hypothetical protein